ncbi:hypothetical protein PTKIN_Ptkin10aG0072900 [Pterospermum kingtungense]
MFVNTLRPSFLDRQLNMSAEKFTKIVKTMEIIKNATKNGLIEDFNVAKKAHVVKKKEGATHEVSYQPYYRPYIPSNLIILIMSCTLPNIYAIPRQDDHIIEAT